MIDWQDFLNEICVTGGIRYISLTALNNLSLAGTFPANNIDIFNLEFRRFTSSYKSNDKISQAGKSTNQSITCYIARKRASVEHLIDLLYNRRIAIKAIDWNGDDHYIIGAQLKVTYNSGENKTNTNGYVFNFEGATARKPHEIAIYKALFGQNGGGSSSGGNSGGGSGSGGGNTPLDDCCITIIQNPISTTPTANNNSESLYNKIVTAPSGDQYFIDHQGNSIVLNVYGRTQKIDGSGVTSYALSEEMKNGNHYIISRNGIDLNIVNSASSSIQIEFDQSNYTLNLSNDWPLESDEFLLIHKIS